MKYCIVADDKTRARYKREGRMLHLEYSYLYTPSYSSEAHIMNRFVGDGKILLFNNRKNAKEYIKGLPAVYKDDTFNIINYNEVLMAIAEWKLRSL
jgi:hypothetical protein